MKKKKGFVFVETLIVVAVLTASLLMLYSTYSALIRKEKTRITYNDSVYLYRTYYLEKFFRNFRLDMIVSNLNKEDLNKPVALLTGFGCTGSIFLNEKNKGMCDSLWNELHVYRMFLAYNDLSSLQDCTNTVGVCHIFQEIGDKDAKISNYLKTIGGQGSNGYRIIVVYAESKDGLENCNPEEESCQLYFATLSLGEFL